MESQRRPPPGRADANLGLEGLTFIPDSYLTSRGFVDQSTGGPYVPADYPDHGNGLFVVGVEKNGAVYVYALEPTAHSAATPVNHWCRTTPHS